MQGRYHVGAHQAWLIWTSLHTFSPLSYWMQQTSRDSFCFFQNSIEVYQNCKETKYQSNERNNLNWSNVDGQLMKKKRRIHHVAWPWITMALPWLWSPKPRTSPWSSEILPYWAPEMNSQYHKPRFRGVYFMIRGYQRILFSWRCPFYSHKSVDFVKFHKICRVVFGEHVQGSAALSLPSGKLT